MKKTAKKAVKKIAKKPATKAVAKKPTKKVAPKKAVKKIAKAAPKKVAKKPVKKAVPKKVVKKTIKKIVKAAPKKAIKKIVKVAPKKAIKKTVKAAPKKAVAKKSAVKKVAAKKVIVKKAAAKKPLAKRAVAKKAPATKTKKLAVVKVSAPPAPRYAGPDWPLMNVILDSIEDSKAEQVIAINLEGRSSMADGMVIASGRANRHVAAIADQLVTKLKAHGQKDIRVEGLDQSDWVLVDAGNVIVHIFRPEVRSFYNLEKLWSEHSPVEQGTMESRDAE